MDNTGKSDNFMCYALFNMSFKEFQDDIFYGSDKIIRTPALHGPSNGIGIGEALYMALQKHKGNIAQVTLRTF